MKTSLPGLLVACTSVAFSFGARGSDPPHVLPEGLVRDGAKFVCVIDSSVMLWVPSRLTHGAIWGGEDDQAVVAGYFIGEREVTWLQWDVFCKATGYNQGPAPMNGGRREIEDSPARPVCRVNWDDAAAYCAWAGLHLPTTDEWLFAATRGEARRFPWGNQDLTATRANVSGRSDGFSYTSPVGSFPLGASPFGVLDMFGNVAEWLADTEGLPDTRRLSVGGSWNSTEWNPTPLRPRSGWNQPRATDRRAESLEIGFRVIAR